MLHNVGQAKDEIQALLQGTILERVGNVNGALERAARTTVQQADIPEASGKESINLFGGVSYYPAPTTLYGTAINLIRRQGETSNPWDYNYKVPIDEFTRGKKRTPNGYMLDLEYRNGVAALGISTPNISPKVIIDGMNATTGWVAGGSLSALAQDTTSYFELPASLRFTLTGASAGFIEKTLTNSLNLSSYQTAGTVFLAINTPSASFLTSLVLRLGSDSTNYLEVTQTTGFLGSIIANNWLLVAFDLSTATTTGVPNFATLSYMRIVANHTATITNFRMGGLFTALPVPHEILFQSSAIFLPAGSSAPSQAITNDGDTILLNDDAYNLFLHESALTIAMQEGGSMETGFGQTLNGILHGMGNNMGLYNLYRADNPSESLRNVGTYYD